MDPSTDICRICGVYADRDHYGVRSCGACGYFFKRHLNSPGLECVEKTNNCVIDVETRSKCTKCRMQKCLLEGMKRDSSKLPEISPCQVCECPSSARCFTVSLCYPCTRFWREYGKKNNNYECVSGTKNCDLKDNTIKKCKKCRLEKCLELGLRPEWICSTKTPQIDARQLCLICTSPSRILYFGVPSCRACQTFFRYAVLTKSPGKCKSGNDCKITPENRTCGHCRFEKCLQVGFIPEFVGNLSKQLEHRKKMKMAVGPTTSQYQPVDHIQGFAYPVDPAFPGLPDSSNYDGSATQGLSPSLNASLPSSFQQLTCPDPSLSPELPLTSSILGTALSALSSSEYVDFEPFASGSSECHWNQFATPWAPTHVSFSTFPGLECFDPMMNQNATGDSAKASHNQSSSFQWREEELHETSAASQRSVTSRRRPSRSRKPTSSRKRQFSPSPALVQSHRDVSLAVSPPPEPLIITFNAQTLATIVECLTSAPFFKFSGFDMTMPSAKFIMWIANSNLKNFVENRAKMHPMIKELKEEALNSMLQTSWIALHIIDVAYATINDQFQDEYLLGNGDRVTSAEIGILGCEALNPEWQDLLQKLRGLSCIQSVYAIIHTMLIFLNNADQFQKIVDYVGEEWSTKASAIFEIVGGIRGLADTVKDQLTQEKRNGTLEFLKDGDSTKILYNLIGN